MTLYLFQDLLVPFQLPWQSIDNNFFQDFHEDFDKEVKLSLVDTEAVDDQRRTLEETWDTYKYNILLHDARDARDAQEKISDGFSF